MNCYTLRSDIYYSLVQLTNESDNGFPCLAVPTDNLPTRTPIPVLRLAEPLARLARPPSTCFVQPLNRPWTEQFVQDRPKRRTVCITPVQLVRTKAPERTPIFSLVDHLKSFNWTKFDGIILFILYYCIHVNM